MKKMTVSKETWGSHIPVNQAILQTFDVKGVVELGVGFFSTPVFLSGCDNVLSIETDSVWVDEVSGQFNPHINHKIVFHDIAPASRTTNRSSLPESFFDEVTKFYKAIDMSEYNLLFIDCASPIRYHSFQILADQFDIVVLHDVNKNRGLVKHWNNGVGLELDGYQRYTHESYPQHTGVYFKDTIHDKFESFEKLLEEKCQEFNGSKSVLKIW